MSWYDDSLSEAPRAGSNLGSHGHARRTVPWWGSSKLHWLLAAPAIALAVVALCGKQLHSARSWMAVVWWSDRAEQQLSEDHFPAALEHIDRAIAWMPDDPSLYYVRAQIRVQAQDLPGALADYDFVIDQAPRFAPAYTGRAFVKRRLGLDREAIEDLTRAIELQPASDPYPLNHRAYVRALAKLELPQALEDIQQAITLREEPDAALLDTRGYIHYLLGNTDQAESDLAQAIALAEAQTKELLDGAGFELLTPAQQKRLKRIAHENLAVMYHHRSLVHERLGKHQLAQRDGRLANEFGYAPERGVE